MARPPKRPNPLDEGIAEKIALRLIAGESIRSICADETMPALTMVYQAMAQNEEFRNIIARAREAQQDAIIDETIDLADSATPENHQVVKLQIWARQWRAAKLAPKRYGDRLMQEVTGRDGGPIQTEEIGDKELARRLAFVIAKGARDNSE